MVIATIRLTPQPARRREVMELLQSVQGPALARLDCLESRICEEVGKHGVICYREHWNSEAGLREHIRSDLYLNLLVALELASRPPEICFYSVSSTRGLEFIASLRAPEEAGCTVNIHPEEPQ
jgi:quinol monooxygenase YgiN